jgi:hypothetical protein
LPLLSLHILAVSALLPYNLTPDNTIFLIFFHIFSSLHITFILSLSFIFSPAFPLPYLCSPFSMVLCYCLLFLLFIYVYIYINIYLMFFPFTFYLFPPFLSPILTYTVPMFSLLQRYLIYSHSGDTRCHPTTPFPFVSS